MQKGPSCREQVPKSITIASFLKATFYVFPVFIAKFSRKNRHQQICWQAPENSNNPQLPLPGFTWDHNPHFPMGPVASI